MINNKTFLCVIPARGGSKGIPDKNLVDFNGYPLIYYVIEAAKQSGIFDRIVVSTDSSKIRLVARKCGADVPFLRPVHLATDDAIVEDAIVHLLENIGEQYDYVCLLQPTSPLTEFIDINNAVFMLFDKSADMIVSVSETPFNVGWAKTLPPDCSMKNFSSDICGSNRQSYGKTYFLNGAIYLGKWDIFYNKKDYYKQDCYAYIMPYERSIDIDSERDLKIALVFLKKKEIENGNGAR